MTLKQIFNHTSTGILAAASILAVASIASRALGFIRNALLASSFGAGEILDAYFLAFRLPDLFFNLLFFGALSAGFVPVFMKLYKKDSSPKGEAWQLANDIFNLSLLTFSFFGVIFFFIAPWVLERMAPGFSPETMALAVTMSRIMFLQPIFLGISGIFSGVLQSARKFFNYSLAPIFYNAGIIFGILVLVPAMGSVGLAWGVVVGALLHLLIQYPAAKTTGWHWRPVLNPGLKSLKRVLFVMVPRSLALIVQQVNLIILISLATILGVGSVSIFNFANDIYGFPLGVVVIPLSVAAFPAFVSAAQKGKHSLAAVFTKTLQQLLFIMTPLVVLALVLRAQVVRLTLGYGQFGWEDTILTIDTLTFLLLGLLFHGILSLVMRAFFALEDAKTPLFILLIGTGITIASAFWFRGIYGVAGLGLALAIGTTFNALALFIAFSIKVRLKRLGQLLRSFGMFIVAAIIGGLAARATLFILVDYFITTEKVWGLLVQATIATIVGASVYLFVTWLFKVPEIETLRTKLGLRPPEGVVFEEIPEEELPR